MFVHTVFRLCMWGKKEEENEQEQQQQQNQNFHLLFSQLWEELMELWEYVCQWNSQAFLSKRGVKIFLSKLSASRDGPEKITETRKG